jgi:hypothetical protein
MPRSHRYLVSFVSLDLTLTTLQSSTASFSFNGTGVYLYGAKRWNHGSYTVTVDGVIVQNASGVGDDIYQALLYGISDMEYGLHHIILTNTGAPSYVDLDYVVITIGDGKPK